MGEEGWKPLLTLCSILSTFEAERPNKCSGRKIEDVKDTLNLHIEATNKLLTGLTRVIEEIGNDFNTEKSQRAKLSKDSDILLANQTAAKASEGIKDLKSDLTNSMHTFAIHNLDNSILPNPPNSNIFNTKSQFGEILNIPSDLLKDMSFNHFKRKSSTTSTLIVKCPDMNTKYETEKIVRSKFKTSINLPKYIFQFVKKLRPLYVKRGKGLDKISCDDPYILIKPTKNCDKLCVLAKDHSKNDSTWIILETLNLPYPRDIVDTQSLSQRCISKILSEEEISSCIPNTFL